MPSLCCARDEQSSYVKPPAPRDGVRKRGLWRWLGYKSGAAVVELEPHETRCKTVWWLSVLAFQHVRIQATLLSREGFTYQEPSRLAPWPYRKANLESVRFLPYRAKFCFVLLFCAGDRAQALHMEGDQHSTSQLSKGPFVCLYSSPFYFSWVLWLVCHLPWKILWGFVQKFNWFCRLILVRSDTIIIRNLPIQNVYSINFYLSFPV